MTFPRNCCPCLWTLFLVQGWTQHWPWLIPPLMKTFSSNKQMEPFCGGTHARNLQLLKCDLTADYRDPGVRIKPELKIKSGSGRKGLDRLSCSIALNKHSIQKHQLNRMKNANRALPVDHHHIQTCLFITDWTADLVFVMRHKNWASKQDGLKRQDCESCEIINKRIRKWLNKERGKKEMNKQVKKPK